MKLLQDMTEPELRRTMNALARAVVDTAADMGVEKPQFVLLLFNDPKICQYVANCERASVIEAMRETAHCLSHNEDIPR
jgi:hypothetical protein